MPDNATATSLWTYLRGLAHEWLTIAVGALLALDIILLRAQGYPIPRWSYLVLLALAYLVASFRVWLVERRRAIKAETMRPTA
jgi:hypothetical protein